MRTLLALLSTLALAALFLSDDAVAQDHADAEALAKALSNPVAALISVPFQLNYDSGLGAAGNGERWTMNLQPVVPLDLSSDWNLISRTIAPFIVQSGVAGDDSEAGLGDIVQSLFFSPKTPTSAGWIRGVGPAFLLPTATDASLGVEQWATGPTAVALKQTATGWTYGALANHLVSVTGDDNRGDVNATFLQPFVSKSLGMGRTISLNFEGTYDWEAEQWSLPLNISYSRVTKVGGQLVSFASGARAWLETPEGGADWGARVTITLLFTK